MVEPEDRISLLPDCLLLEIISRLELSTKHVIKTTTTISKRWQHLWTRLSTLVFIDQVDILYGRSHKNAYTNYFSFIDKILPQCPTNVKLKKFKFQIEDDSCTSRIITRHSSQVNSWIRYAITRNVQEVEISCPGKLSYDDELFFNNSCIMSMKLSHDRGCDFNPPNGVISWDKLKCLCIDRGTLDEDSLGISRSPCLETLELNNCHLAGYFLKSLSGKFGVERLSCDFITYESFSYDLFDNDDNEFISIKLSRCEFNPPDGISWEKLKCLCVDYGTFDEHSIGKILSRSPCLETLELKWCRGVRRIDVTSKSVKNLVLHGYGYRVPGKSYIDTLEINAPYILSLKITGKIYLERFLLENVSSLVKADFNYLSSHTFADKLRIRRDDVEEDLLTGLLSSLGHVNDITLGHYNCLYAATRLREKGVQFYRAGAGDEDRIPELIASGYKKVDDAYKKIDDANKKISDELKKLKRIRYLMQLPLKQRQENIVEKGESETEENVEETEESDDDMGFSLFN